jgi:hypothetical protein
VDELLRDVHRNPVGLPTPQSLTLAQFCDHIHVKRSYGHQLKKEGRLVLAADGKLIDVAQSLAKIADTKDPSKAGVAARHADARGGQALTGHSEIPIAATSAPAQLPEDGEDAAPTRGYDYQGSKAKKEHFAALEAEASYRQKIRDLLEASEVRSVLAETITVLRTAIEGLPYRLSPVLAATDDEVQIKSILGAEVEFALKTASDALTKLGRGEY